MCGRFLLTSPADAVRAAFGLDRAPGNLPPRRNIAPTQAILAIRLAEPDSASGAAPGSREPAVLRWGLVPGWMKALPAGRPMINARVETAADKPFFRAAFRRRRCLVPADGWYEWTVAPGGGRQPRLIRLADPAARPFAFAGLWERWHGPGGEHWLESVAILTRPALPGLAAIHDRMPLVLAPEAHDAWLAPQDPPRGEPLADLAQPADGAYEHAPVSRRLDRAGEDAAPPEGATEPAQGRLF